MTAFGLALVLLVQTARGDISCGNEERRALCSHCPDIYRDGEFMRQDLNRCHGDCELTWAGSEYVCVLPAPSAPETPEPIAPTEPPAEAPAPSASSAPTYASYPEYSTPQATLLTMVELDIVNSASFRPIKVSFKAEVCVGQACCQTGVMLKRSGVFKFGSVFDNLGNCNQLRKGPNDEVAVKAITWHTATPLKVYRITAQFEDGSLFTAENSERIRWSWRRQRSPVPWNTLSPTTRSNVRSEATYSEPPPNCPEHATNLTNTNTCPKVHIRVLRSLADERKFCYYQECATFTKDLSTVENGPAGLGSGGYCKSRRDFFPQYQYCCDLEQYFTLDDEEATAKPQEEIHFPRCPYMIERTP